MSQHSHLYNCARWRRKRAAQLRKEPWCRKCAAGECQHQARTSLRLPPDGKLAACVTKGTVADHTEPHNGDLMKFWNNPLQTLCANCHSSLKQLEEKGSFTLVHPDGYPEGFK